MKPYTETPPFYAQWGEDRWLATHFHIPHSGVFVDVGAGNGERGSNTLHFENLGWHGLCIDADPRNHDPLRARRGCIVETCAVARTSGLATFGMYAHKPSWSGLLGQNIQGRTHVRFPDLMRAHEGDSRRRQVSAAQCLVANWR